MKNKGYFISFEGIDGSGKSTQIQKLAEFLEDRDFEIVITREPGGSIGAEVIRNLLLQGNVDRWSAETEILLFTAARRDHLERIILPALEEGKIVICDRFTDSTRMYQGMRGVNLRNLVDTLNEKISVKEAQKLKIPIFAMVDTNSDPGEVDYIIPSNDDASKSIEKILSVVCKAIQEGLDERKMEKEAENEGSSENTETQNEEPKEVNPKKAEPKKAKAKKTETKKAEPKKAKAKKTETKSSKK